MAFDFNCTGEACKQMFANLSQESFIGGLLGGVAGGALFGMIVALGIFALLLGLAVYVYFSFTWMTIAKKKNYKYPWLAWIPFASTAMRLQLAKKFHWAWTFLYLVPILGWLALMALVIISNWITFESLKFPGWLSLAPIVDLVLNGVGTLAYLVIIGLVAYSKKR